MPRFDCIHMYNGTGLSNGTHRADINVCVWKEIESQMHYHSVAIMCRSETNGKLLVMPQEWCRSPTFIHPSLSFDSCSPNVSKLKQLIVCGILCTHCNLNHDYIPNYRLMTPYITTYRFISKMYKITHNKCLKMFTSCRVFRDVFGVFAFRCWIASNTCLIL